MAVESDLMFSPLTGRVYYGRINKNTGVAYGNKKDVTSTFIYCAQQKFKLGYGTEITVDGVHKSTMYHVEAGVEIYSFKPVNPDDIDGEKYNQLTALVGSKFFDDHGCCENCHHDLKDELGCDCKKLGKVQTLIMELSKK